MHSSKPNPRQEVQTLDHQISNIFKVSTMCRDTTIPITQPCTKY